MAPATASDPSAAAYLSPDEAEWLATELARLDANEVCNRIDRLWNGHELGPEARDENPERWEGTTDRCRFRNNLQAAGCFKCNRDFNGHGGMRLGKRPLPERKRNHRLSFGGFANKGEGTLDQLLDMPVRRLRWIMHVKFDHPMCWEARGVCVAVDPCGEGPFLVFVGVDPKVALPDPQPWVLVNLVERRKRAANGERV